MHHRCGCLCPILNAGLSRNNVFELRSKQKSRSQNIISVSHLNHSVNSFNIQIDLYFLHFYPSSLPFRMAKHVAPECSRFSFFFLLSCLRPNKCMQLCCKYIWIHFDSFVSLAESTIRKQSKILAKKLIPVYLIVWPFFK